MQPTYNIEIPGQYRNPNTPFPINFLSGIQAITGIRIRSTSGSGGPINAAPYPSCTRIYYDDFTFTPDLAVGITSGRVSGVLNGTTQNALLGAEVALQATIFPSGMSGGTYVWSATGPKQQVSATNTSSSYTLRWTESGTHQVSVTYTRNGVSVSGTVNVQVRVPTLTSFSGVASNTVVNRGSNCGDLFNHQPFGTTVSMGCSLLQDGMVYSATATIPNVTYLSDPGNTGIIFKQIVSAYRKRNNRGRFECRTARNPQSDPTTGWQVDSIAGEFYSPGVTFSNGTTITHEESDLPATSVSGRLNTEAGETFEYEAFLADDLFETYVYYFAGANSALIDVSAANTDSTLVPTELAKNLVDERKVAKEFALLVADVIKDK